MSYTYTPGTRPDALAILRDKGLLDTPKRLDPKPGTFVLSAQGHFRIREDGSTEPVGQKHFRPLATVDQPPILPILHKTTLGLTAAIYFGLLPVAFAVWMGWL